MAEQNKQEQEQPRKKSPMTTILLVAAAMILEAAAVFAFIAFSGFGAGSAQASSIDGEELAEMEQTVEIPLVEDRFQNLASGQAWTWQIEAALQVRQKHQERVNAELERRRAEITEGVAMIIRRAAHAHLTEPGLETLHRQLAAYVEEIFGFDASGEPLIERVLLPKCQGSPPI